MNNTLCRTVLIFVVFLLLINISYSQNVENERSAYSGHFQVSSAGTQEIEEIGFEPDAIKFYITNTISDFDRDSTHQGQEHGQGHGFARCSNKKCSNIGLTTGSGSASMDGQVQSSSDFYSIYQVVTDDDGTYTNGWIKGRVINTTSDGFKLSFDNVYKSQFVTYTAYNFGEESEVDIGYFSTPSELKTQKIKTNNTPNFVNIKMTPQITEINQTVENGLEDGWMHGFAAKHNDSINQLSMSLTSYSNDRNNHVFASSNSNIIRLLKSDYYDGVDGRVTASLKSFEKDGFTLNYSSVESNQLGMYMAVETKLIPELGYTTSPKSTGVQEIDTDVPLNHVQILSSNTISDINVEGFSEDNQLDNNMGWMFGTGNSSHQRSMMVATHSSSQNGHATTSSDSEALRMLYSEQDEQIRGRESASIISMEQESFKLNWTKIENTSNEYVPYDTNLIGYYGFTDIERDFCDERGPKNECILRETREISPENYSITTELNSKSSAIIRSLSGLSTLNITNKTIISGLWEGSFEIITKKPRLKAGAKFRPENGNIRIGN